MELLVPNRRHRSLRLRLASGSGAVGGVVAARPAARLMRQALGGDTEGTSKLQ